MPGNARIYIFLVSAAGLAAAVLAFANPWPLHDPLQFCTYFVLSLFAAVLKLRLPGLTGTMSIGFVVVLLGISELSLPEAMLMACTGVIAQCLWRAKQRPTAVQVLFSVSAVALSVTVTHGAVQLLRSKSQMESLAVLMALATCCYFACNSALVAGVLSMVQRKPFRAVWEECYLLSFPYYLLGGAVAGMIAASSRQIGWQLSLVMLPIMGLAYVFYHIYIDHLTMTAPAGAMGTAEGSH
jgi:hypothetical protein